MRLKRYASIAMVAGIGLTTAACGSSSSSTSPTTAAGSGTSASSAPTDTVTAINSVSGATSVTLNPSTAAALTKLGVKLAPAGSATFAGSTVTFPITSGYAEIHSNHAFAPGYILGSIQHDGSGLTLSAGGKSVTLSDFVVDPGDSMLYGTVGGKPDVPLLYLNGAAVKVTPTATGVALDGTVAELTKTAATALNTAFGTTALAAGIPLGTVHLAANGTANMYTGTATRIPRVGGQSTNVALEPTTVAALTKLGVKLGTYGTATLSGTTVSFPITGGFAAIHSDASYKPGYIAGSIIHQGSGITLTAGKTTVTLSNFVVDPGDSVLTGEVNGAGPGTQLLFLNGANVKVTPTSVGATLDGTVAELTAGAAAALDKAFGTTALTAGIPLGTVHLVATAQTAAASVNS